MDREAEDMLIALYLTRESEMGYSNADLDRLSKTLKLIKKVREEMKKGGV